MLIGDLGKYNVFSSSSVCTVPPSSFHVHFTVPIQEGGFNLPPIVSTMPTVVDLKVINISLLLQMWVFAELSQTTKLASVLNILLPFDFLTLSSTLYAEVNSTVPQRVRTFFSCHAAWFYDSMSKAWVKMVYLSGLRIYVSVSPSIFWIWGR